MEERARQIVAGAARRRETQRAGLRRALADVETFSAALIGVPLRPYQAAVARAVLTSISEGHGRTFTVMMPRQSGKNQLSQDRP